VAARVSKGQKWPPGRGDAPRGLLHATGGLPPVATPFVFSHWPASALAIGGQPLARQLHAHFALFDGQAGVFEIRYLGIKLHKLTLEPFTVSGRKGTHRVSFLRTGVSAAGATGPHRGAPWQSRLEYRGSPHPKFASRTFHGYGKA